MNSTKKLTYTGIMTALVFLATYSIKVPIPFTNGYIHLGDCMVFLSAIILGWKSGAFAAGVGSMLADIVGGYAHWAIPTLIIKSLMAMLIGIAIKLRGRVPKTVFTVSIAVVWLSFITGMKKLLYNSLINDAEDLVKEIETANSVAELEGLSRLVQAELSLSALIVALVAAGIGFFIYRKGEKLDVSIILGMIASGLWMVMAYYFAAYLIYGNFVIPVFSIPMNLVQFVMGFVLAVAVYLPLKKHLKDLLQ